MVKKKSETATKDGIVIPGFRHEVGNRIREVEQLFKNREEAANTAQVAKSTLQNWGDGVRDPSFEGLARLAQAKNISLDWLAFGNGPRYRQSQTEKTEKSVGYEPVFVGKFVKDDYVHVPIYDARAAAGAGAMDEIQETDGLPGLALGRELAARFVHGPRNRLAAIWVTGDSMKPTFDDGDALIVDTAVERVAGDAVYVITSGDLCMVKRVTCYPDGSIMLASDNKDYGTISVRPSEVDQVRVFGRVVATLRHL